MTRIPLRLLALLASTLLACSEPPPPNHVEVEQGWLAGIDGSVEGVRAFLGIPYGAPPTGDRRWAPAEPAAAWEGVRAANAFGDRCIQTSPFPDMLFQSASESEDCLSLSLWTPGDDGDGLPVMVWIHGGGYFSGAGDEKRHDGSRLAAKGVVLVTINYRLAALGFLAHPDLTAESPHGASGNYGLLDMILALEWVRDNVAAFGGDPGNVTIFGESAGSFAVSALMASPPARGLFHKAIGQSGAHFGRGGLTLQPLEQAEADGATFETDAGVSGIAALRALPPESLVAAQGSNAARFRPVVDGYVLPESVWDVFARGGQSPIPLLAGWNSAEAKWVPRGADAVPAVSAEQLDQELRNAYPDDYEAARAFYPDATPRDRIHSAIALRSERNFVGYGAWKWIELHAAAGLPVYRYLFDQIVPFGTEPPPPDDPGAAHATDIEYVFETLASKDRPWRAEDQAVAERMATWWTTFARTGDPNGPGLPAWPAWPADGDGDLMRINAASAAEPEHDRPRFEFMDRIERREHAQRWR